MEKDIECYCPECKKIIPIWRVKYKRITCSKKCAMDWNWLPVRIRNEIKKERGNEYG